MIAFRSSKGWLDAQGKTQERIYDVAVSDGRKIDAEGHCETPVGNTVDIANASYTNTIGAPLLNTYWKDPHFDPRERAFYYVRVLEIPSPRWTAFDAKFYGVKMDPSVPMLLQERAYTSPIWYTRSLKNLHRDHRILAILKNYSSLRKFNFEMRISNSYL